jgi:UDP-glucose 4-epimerase
MNDQLSGKKRKTALVTGGAGFIGSQVNKLLFKKGYETIILDDLSSGSSKAIVGGAFIKGDFGHRPLLDAIFSREKIDAVIHLAALLDVGESVKEPIKYYFNNVVKTMVLLDAMQRHSVEFLVFSSSAAVYGDPKNRIIKESDSCDPINPYGHSKLIVEQILKNIGLASGMKYCALRYFNVAGGDPEGEIKNFKEKESNLIPVILRSLKKENRTVTIFGTDYPTFDGTAIRDYVHVYDIAEAHIAAMESLFNGASSNIFNLGNARGFSVRQVIATVEMVTGRKVRIIEGQRRVGDPALLLANAEKAKSELNWHPHYPALESMIEHAWRALDFF